MTNGDDRSARVPLLMMWNRRRAEHGAEQGAGHGLGLAIAQRIAQRHGGGVTAESVEGQGSTFTVELPVADDE